MKRTILFALALVGVLFLLDQPVRSDCNPLLIFCGYGAFRILDFFGGEHRTLRTAAGTADHSEHEE